MEKLLNEVKQYRKEQAELLDWNKHNGHPVMVSFDEGGLNACDKIIAIIERAGAKADSTSEKDLRVCEVMPSGFSVNQENAIFYGLKELAEQGQTVWDKEQIMQSISKNLLR